MEEKQEQVKRSRGKFKPEMRNLSNEDIKEILLQKNFGRRAFRP